MIVKKAIWQLLDAGKDIQRQQDGRYAVNYLKENSYNLKRLTIMWDLKAKSKAVSFQASIS